MITHSVYPTLMEINYRKDPPSDQHASIKKACFLILKTVVKNFYLENLGIIFAVK